MATADWGWRREKKKRGGLAGLAVQVCRSDEGVSETRGVVAERQAVGETSAEARKGVWRRCVGARRHKLRKRKVLIKVVSRETLLNCEIPRRFDRKDTVWNSGAFKS